MSEQTNNDSFKLENIDSIMVNFYHLAMSNITISFVILITLVFIFSYLHKKYECVKNFSDLIHHNFFIIYFIFLLFLTTCLVHRNLFSNLNYEKFTGQNIIFLIWLALLIFPIITRIKFGDFEFKSQDNDVSSAKEQFKNTKQQVETALEEDRLKHSSEENQDENLTTLKDKLEAITNNYILTIENKKPEKK